MMEEALGIAAKDWMVTVVALDDQQAQTLRRQWPEVAKYPRMKIISTKHVMIGLIGT